MSNQSANDNVIALLEAKLLGNVIHNNRAYARIEGIVRPEHFSDPVHGKILSAISALTGAGCVADIPALHSIFEKSNVLDEVGGAAYLYQLPVEGAAHSETVKLARQVRSVWAVSRLADLGQELVSLG
jgi:replicative DNA helicase